MRRTLSAFVACALFALFALFMTPAHAMKPDGITESEMALVPPYCKDSNTFGYGGAEYNSSPNAPKWVAVMGKTFWAIHHYCWALINLSRIQRGSVSPMVKQSVRETALGDLMYVIEQGEDSSVVMPEVYAKIGEVHLALNHERQAAEAYAHARALRPNYWPAYSQWAEYLMRKGRKPDARKVVEEGLAYAPESKSLQILYRDLGGDPATVKPRTPPEKSADGAPGASPSAAN